MSIMRIGLILLGLGGIAAADSEVVITEAVVDPSISDLPLAPWVTDDDRTWTQAQPLFTLTDDQADTSADGWVAVSMRGILLRVVVRDDRHVNDKTDGAIWQGDCLQVGIDAMGDGVPDQPMDANDAAMAFALTDTGPVAWAYHHGRAGGTGAMPQIQPVITRNNQDGTTAYEITLPWSEFQVQPGLSPVLGIAVQVNDSDGGMEQTRLHFGQGAGGRPRPGLFRKLRLGTPRAPVLAVSVEQDNVWRAGDGGEILLAVGGHPAVEVRAEMGDAQAALVLPASAADAAVRRFMIRGMPHPLPTAPLPLKVTVADTDGKVLLTEQATLRPGGQVFADLNDRLDALAARSPNPVFTRHLRTVQTLANNEWQLARFQLDESTTLAENALALAEQVLEGLEAGASDWSAYLQRRRKLVLGFVAPADRTVQYYIVTLPMNWQPDKTYPMIVFLHGGGTSHVAFEVASSLFSGPQREPAEARFPGDFDTLYIEPYARGRHGYHGIAERDVLLAVDDAMRTFKVDPDRVYLTGFSMGGAGAWAVAAHTPDRWAAVCINAGAPRRVPTGIGIGRNYLGLPVRISHGDDDPTIRPENAIRMADELRAHGCDPDLILLPGVSHTYYGEPHESANLAWLTSHTRTRPDHFGFTAETSDHRGRNGVTLTRDPAVSFNPWFECRIDGNSVHLTSDGTPALAVQLGEAGLGLSGDVTVFHEDKQVYHGPPVRIRINTADHTVTQPHSPGESRRGRR